MEGYCDGGKNSSRVLRAKEQEEEEEELYRYFDLKKN